MNISERSIPLAFLAVLLISGCISVNPDAIIASSAVVRDFLNDYPNAEVTTTFYSKDDSGSIIDSIKSDCKKETVVPKDFYKVEIVDHESGLSVTAWVDWNMQIVECAVKKGATGTEDDSTTDNESCYDADGGKNIYEKSVLERKWSEKSGASLPEECIGNSLREYYCDGDSFEMEIIECEHGCSDGACLKVDDAECFDTDGGVNIHEKGVCETADERLSDHCDSSGKLNEKYCEDGTIKWEEISCPGDYVCEDGECTIVEIEEIEEKCKETDNGLDLFNKGVTEADIKRTDSCDHDFIVLEHYCENDEVEWVKVSCPVGYECVDGECVVTENEYTCEETDDGRNFYSESHVKFYKNGDLIYTMYDSCRGASDELIEYFCSDDVYYERETVNCELGCLHGICLDRVYEECTAYEDEAHCLKYNDEDPTINSVNNCYWDYETSKCYVMNTDMKECTDDDGGIDYNVKSNTYGFHKCSGCDDMDREKRYTNTDRCDSNGVLVEYYCIDDYLVGESIKYGCVCEDGACVAEGIITDLEITDFVFSYLGLDLVSQGTEVSGCSAGNIIATTQACSSITDCGAYLKIYEYLDNSCASENYPVVIGEFEKPGCEYIDVSGEDVYSCTYSESGSEIYTYVWREYKYVFTLGGFNQTLLQDYAEELIVGYM